MAAKVRLIHITKKGREGDRAHVVTGGIADCWCEPKIVRHPSGINFGVHSGLSKRLENKAIYEALSGGG